MAPDDRQHYINDGCEGGHRDDPDTLALIHNHTLRTVIDTRDGELEFYEAYGGSVFVAFRPSDATMRGVSLHVDDLPRLAAALTRLHSMIKRYGQAATDERPATSDKATTP